MEQTINVIFIGSSQSGKSTLIKALQNPSMYECSSKTGFAETKDPYHISFTLTLPSQNSDDDRSYRFSVIDTPGLKEIREKSEDNRTDDELLHEIKTFIQTNMDSINCLCFVSAASRTQQNDIDIFKQFINIFGESYASVSLMVLTHGESLKQELLDRFRQELASTEKSKGVSSYCQLGMVYHGMINESELGIYSNDLILQENVYKARRDKVKHMREKFIEKITSTARRCIPIEFPKVEVALQSEKIEESTTNPTPSDVPPDECSTLGGVKSKLTESERGVLESDQLETGVLESIQSETGLGEPSQSETGLGEPPQSETGLGEPSQSETGLGEPSQSDTGVPESFQSETGLGEPSQSETGLGEPSQSETGLGEPSQSETGVPESIQSETGLGEPPQSETGLGEPPQSETGVLESFQTETRLPVHSQLETEVAMTSTGEADERRSEEAQCYPRVRRTGQESYKSFCTLVWILIFVVVLFWTLACQFLRNVRAHIGACFCGASAPG